LCLVCFTFIVDKQCNGRQKLIVSLRGFNIRILAINSKYGSFDNIFICCLLLEQMSTDAWESIPFFGFYFLFRKNHRFVLVGIREMIIGEIRCEILHLVFSEIRGRIPHGDHIRDKEFFFSK